MFINRQKIYFDDLKRAIATSIQWKSAGDHIFRHDNYQTDLFYSDPDDLCQIVQSPRMLDLVFGGREKKHREAA